MLSRASFRHPLSAVPTRRVTKKHIDDKTNIEKKRKTTLLAPRDGFRSTRAKEHVSVSESNPSASWPVPPSLPTCFPRFADVVSTWSRGWWFCRLGADELGLTPMTSGKRNIKPKQHPTTACKEKKSSSPYASVLVFMFRKVEDLTCHFPSNSVRQRQPLHKPLYSRLSSR